MIAVVDDEESIRKALVRLLEASGHAARGFSSGNEFLQRWHADSPHCLMLDLQMPGLSGLDVQRALNREGAHIPVIIITAHDTPSAREECLREGAIAYLCKPLDQRALLQAVTLAENAKK
jgi:FixJ family two-component response regulator